MEKNGQDMEINMILKIIFMKLKMEKDMSKNLIFMGIYFIKGNI